MTTRDEKEAAKISQANNPISESLQEDRKKSEPPSLALNSTIETSASASFTEAGGNEAKDDALLAPESPLKDGSDHQNRGMGSSHGSGSRRGRPSDKKTALRGSYKPTGGPAALSSSNHETNSARPGAARESATSGPEQRRQSKMNEKLQRNSAATSATGAFRSDKNFPDNYDEEEDEEIDVKEETLPAELVEATPVHSELPPVYHAEVVPATKTDKTAYGGDSTEPQPAGKKSAEEIELIRQKRRLCAFVVIAFFIFASVTIIVPSVILGTKDDSSSSSSNAVTSPSGNGSVPSPSDVPLGETVPPAENSNLEDGDATETTNPPVVPPSSAPPDDNTENIEIGKEETEPTVNPTTMTPAEPESEAAAPTASPADQTTTPETTEAPVTAPIETTPAPVATPVNPDVTNPPPTFSPTWSSTASPTSEPTAGVTDAIDATTAPDSVPAENDVVLDNLPADTQDAILSDPQSPQAQANSWIANDPNLSSYTEEEKRERFALATFYYAFGGDSWVPSSKAANSNWLEYGTDVCEWNFAGIVTTCANGAVQTVEATRFAGFAGSMPPEVSLLTALERISLEGNLLSVPLMDLVPESFSQLTNLKELDLQDNEITDLTALAAQQLDNRLVAIESLDISKNFLSGAIPGFGLASMNTLRYLYLSGNNFSGPLDTELGRLTGLRQLSFRDNSLTGTPIPNEIARLDLGVLDLHRNLFVGAIPVNVGQMKTLFFLDLGQNDLTGTIPAGVASLTLLDVLNLSENNLTGEIPAQLSSLTGLSELALHDNYLEGPIPRQLSSLTALEVLSLSGNGITGTIPTELALLTALEELNVGSTFLSGSLPVELASLTSLQYLNLNGTNVMGSVPSEFCSLTSLELIQVDCTLLECECLSCECL